MSHAISSSMSNGNKQNPLHPEGTFYTNFAVDLRPLYERTIRQFKQRHPDAPIQFHISDTPVAVVGSSIKTAALVWNPVLVFGNISITEHPGTWLTKFSDIYKTLTK